MEEQEIQRYWEYYKELLRKTNREGIEDLITWLDSTDFKYAPASTKFHGNFKGGLLLHSINVYYHMYDFKNFIDFFEIPEESIIITSLLHDICKVYTYSVSMRNTKNENGQWIQVPYYELNDMEPIGHGEKSIMYMYEHNVKPTKIERAMIRNHMGFSGNNYGNISVSDLFTLCPQSLVLHWADELSTFVTENNKLSAKFKNKLYGRTLGESNSIKKQIEIDNTITINGKTFKLAPEDSEVDGENIIEIKLQNVLIKVYKN